MITVRFILPESSLVAKQRQKEKKSQNKEQAAPSTSDVYEALFKGTVLSEVFAKINTPEPLKPEDYIGEYEWSFKEENPFIYRKKGSHSWEDLVNSTTVVTKADGPELELIRTHFQNIPWVINRRGTCEWTGEFAKFIALNFDFKT